MKRRLSFITMDAGATSARRPTQRGAFVQGDVVCFIALDLVLRLILARVMNIAFIVYVFGVDLYDRAADPPGFRVPAYVIANFECLCHNCWATSDSRRSR